MSVLDADGARDRAHSAAAPNSLRQLLSEGSLRGVVQVIPAVEVTEVLARSCADFVMLDGEHADFSPGSLGAYVRAAEYLGMPVLYRAESSSAPLGKALDSGVAGIVVPRVESGAEARRVARATRFAPLGARGLGAGRASGHGTDMLGLLRTANDRVLVAIMIETAGGLEALDEILAVDGIDLVFIGPTDLAASLGVQMGSEEHEQAIERIVTATVRAGRFSGVHCSDEDQARRVEALGARFLSIGLDSVLLAGAARALLGSADHTSSPAEPGATY